MRLLALSLAILITGALYSSTPTQAQYIATAFWQADASAPGAAQSLRFRSAANTCLRRTMNGSTSTWTWSGWIKSTNTVNQYGGLFETVMTTGQGQQGGLGFSNDGPNRLTHSNYYPTYSYNGGRKSTAMLFRDPSSWYHVVTVFQNSAASADRIRLYVNGVRITSFNQNTDNTPAYGSWAINSGLGVGIGCQLRDGANVVYPFDGYMADVYFSDGNALEASAFGEFDGNGVWVPKAFAGPYGTGGFHLEFKNPAALGADTSGLGNDWIPMNFNTTPGNSAYDPSDDAPSIRNFATANVVDPQAGPTIGSYSEGGLRASIGPDSGNTSIITINPTIRQVTGKYYYEITINQMTLHPTPGTVSNYAGVLDTGRHYLYGDIGSIFSHTGSISTSVPAWAVNDVIGVAFDTVGGSISWYRNGAHVYTTSMVNEPATPRVRLNGLNSAYTPGNGNQSITANFGQRPWAYGPPDSSYKMLNADNLPAPAIAKPSDYFKTVTYTGNGSFLNIGEPAKQAAGVNVANSLRFRPNVNSHFNKTLSSSGNTSTWTMSMWLKRSKVGTGARHGLMGTSYTSSAETLLMFHTDDTLAFECYAGGGSLIYGQLRTQEKFMDTTSWHHIVMVWDSSNGTLSDRARLYVDGRRISLFSTAVYPSTSGQGCFWNNNGWTQYLGIYPSSPGYFDGYMADAHFIDGSALDATSFGEFNADGNWRPKAYAGAYGANGFRLDFSDASSVTNLGLSTTGSNHWTPNGFSVAADATNDALTDVPTAYDATHGNFPVLNPHTLSIPSGGNGVLSEGGLKLTGGSTVSYAYSTMPFPKTGKYYFEVRLDAFNVASTGLAYAAIVQDITGAIADSLFWQQTYVGACGAGCSVRGLYNYTGGSSATVSSQTAVAGQVYGFAIDMDTGQSWMSINNAWVTGNPATGSTPSKTFTNLNARSLYAMVGARESGNALTINFGQRAFTYTPPNGFNRVQSYYHANQSFIPDLVIVKNRSSATDWAWYDRARGATLEMSSNLITGQSAQGAGLLSFQNGGFTAGSSAKLNASGNNYISYMFKKGVTPGFDIVTYTGNGTNNRTIAHGLGVAPAFYITKNTDGNNSANGWNDWGVYHRNISTGGSCSGGPNAAWLHNTAAPSSGVGGFCSVPTSGVFSPNQTLYDNALNRAYIAYLFAEVPGFSKFGSYTGNASADGPFVYTGFKPAFVMIKRTDTTGSWQIQDFARYPHNLAGPATLFANLADGDATGYAAYDTDFLSNGFKVRGSTPDRNASGGTYIYAAFAENPFKAAPAR